MMNDTPKRSMRQWTQVERIIYDAQEEIDAMPKDSLLTEAADLLRQARDKVADYVEKIAPK